ncbi:hypothetical protein [Hyphobacterium sp.]|jgi:hypothetical protein|uniref:hypothetical protein n=1 Tax=Hyphobacterium sp. TaxID=2004662 RepID=UPI003BAB0128
MVAIVKPGILIVVAASALAACSAGDDAASETVAVYGDMETLPVEFRVAFMSGHVEAGLALYRAGAPEQAAPHLLHPVSETHAAEREGIDALGFEAGVFEEVSAALGAGRPANEIEPMLAAAEADLALLQDNAGGDARAIIAYLMDVTAEEYAIGVTDGIVTDPGEYQDAYGFSVVARQYARGLDNPDLIDALDGLIALWPEGGPLPESTPAPVADINARIAEVRSIL